MSKSSSVEGFDKDKYEKEKMMPPNLLNPLRYLGGFETSGLSYWLRPGVENRRWQRDVWVRGNGNNYYINNGCDRSRDYYPRPWW
jgi:hypothetical protein